MKKNTLKSGLTFILILIVFTSFSQGVKISTSSGNPHESAILEIESTTQGLLIPRMTSDQKKSISNPTAGLLVFDTDENAFFIYGSAKWVDLSMSSEIWSQTSSNVYLTNSLKNVGIGTTNPTGKFVVKADASKAPDDALFEIQDATGTPVFVITSEGARLYVKDYSVSKGVSGGFAVGRYGTAKGIPGETYLMVTPDSTRVYSRQTGVSGGFAVGRYGTAKGEPDSIYFYTNLEGTKVTTFDSKKKGVSGGFAVGRYGTAKGEADSLYFYTNKDSTRVYTKIDETKGVSGGFAVGRYGTAKEPADNYMHMTKNNYLIGHGSGQSMGPTGLFNVFFGYESGISNTSGSSNVFSGYRTGFSNTTGGQNVFSGYTTGYSNLSGTMNAFTGYQSGYSNTTGSFNSFYGAFSGGINNIGKYNVCIGYSSGYYNDSSDYNVFMGYRAGYKHMGDDNDNNIYIGSYAGFGGSSGDLGKNNVFMGSSSGYNNGIGSENIFIGNQAGYSNNSENNNVHIGYQAGRNSNATSNVFLGYRSGYNSDGNYNVFLGTNAGESASGSDGIFNVFLGYHAGMINDGGDRNIFIGYAAGSSNSDGGNNVCIGNGSGMNNSTGNWNTYLGWNTGLNITTGTSNVFIGAGTGSSFNTSNKLYIDNSGTSSPLIYGDFSSNFLRFNGYVDINSAGDLALQVDGSEALWFDGTYFSWGYGATYNFFNDPVAIGMISPTYKLQLPNNSNIYYGQARAYAWTTYSDSRVKKEQDKIQYGMNEIMQLLPKSYNHYSSEFKNDELILKDEYKATIGLIAQEVYEIIPEAVQKPENEGAELWGLDYEKLMPVLIKGIQEQQSEIEKLKKQIDELKQLIKNK